MREVFGRGTGVAGGRGRGLRCEFLDCESVRGMEVELGFGFGLD